MALVLYRPLFWIGLFILAATLFWLARRHSLRWKPAWVLRFALMTLILFIFFFPRGALFREPLPPRQIMLVDLSESIPEATRVQLQQQAQQWRAGALNRTVIAFGQDVQFLSHGVAEFPNVAGGASNLHEALAAARRIAGDTPSEIFVASDGEATAALAVDAIVSELAQAGHRLYALPVPSEHLNGDVAAGPPIVPPVLWEDTPFSVVIPVYANAAGMATVQLAVDGAVANEQTLQLVAGENAVAFDLRASGVGLMALKVTVTSEGDPRPQNNEGFATSEIFAAPHVLFISDNVDGPFARMLAASGIEIHGANPEAMPSTLAQLEPYHVIVLDNLLSRRLSPEQMAALDVFVSRLGRGLLVLGGHNSYTLGGYRSTSLAPMLPVTMEPPARADRPPVTFAIILDRSESMGEPQPDIPPMDLAQEAAMRAIEVLTQEDYVGVMTYASNYSWDVPLSRTGEGLALRQAQDAISAVEASGVTNMYQALEEAVAEFRETTPTEFGLFLVLSDGQSTDGTTESFRETAAVAREAGITISTIAMGQVRESIELMQMLAAEAGGRFHHVSHPSELPRIMIAESEAARSENVQRGEITVMAGEAAHPVLSGFSPAELPPLDAYIALRSRNDQGAEDILISNGLRDPILSAWQHGLGRVMAWTADAGDNWSGEWLAWDQAPRFWAQVMRYALLNPAAGPAQPAFEVDGDRLHVRARLQNAAGLPLQDATPELIYTAGDGSANAVRTLALVEEGPGLYEAIVPLPQAGAYRAILRHNEAGRTHETPAGFAVNYPPEYRPATHTGGGEAALARWAESTGGGVTSWDLIGVSSETVQEEQTTEAGSLLQQLLLAALLFWPVEIAIRRRWLPWT